MKLIRTKALPLIHVSKEQESFLANHKKVTNYLRNENNLGYLITYQDQIIGFMLVVLFAEHQYFLHDFRIDLNYQHQGFGKKALEKLINILKDKQTKILSTTYTEGNDQAKRVYTSFGFIETSKVNLDNIKEVNMTLVFKR